ncbi:uncharacterized protein LOC143019088 [Oratosquilla oratoria]|uniref:uncharacterized protein LOC143019088 n=1 Tax=Oratosquilla oratoria TaxID=337810 RepID=UPI003F76B864
MKGMDEIDGECFFIWDRESSTTSAIEVVDIDEEYVVFENGTLPSVVLDCVYKLSEDDRLGLSVKWYYNDYPAAVYQWIPTLKPQDRGSLKGRINLDYQASEDEYHRHRALHILHPTSELSGNYKCRVSSFVNEVDIIKKLVIYTQPSRMEVMAKALDDDEVHVRCETDGVFPEPLVNLSIKSGSGSLPAEESKRETTWDNGLYISVVEFTVEERKLGGDVEFECSASIPNTNVSFTRSVEYKPRMKPSEGFVRADNADSSSPVAHPSVLLISLLIACLLSPSSALPRRVEGGF